MRNRLIRHWSWVALAATTLSAARGGESPVDFGREVLPVLSDHCFQCHGPDPASRKAGLRLDTAGGALRLKDAVIVPGQSEESEVYHRINSTDPDEVMPPPSTGRPLSPEQVATLKVWIDQGAPWGKHWAFEPVRKPPSPSLKNPEWPRDAIDRFVLARLETDALAPSPEADKATLLRRASLDLTGIPPSPDAVDAFLGDDRPDAYERQVDRLLASPQYGERMAWDWLDAARYADSNGYQGDADRTMWPWRDWVVSAINRGLPYDDFTTWQLAGDLVPGGGDEQTLATAFCRNHMINGEGGRIAEENRVDYVMDMAETTGTVWLGLTFNCCRCHDHKFDPIRQTDYYQLFAFFNQTPVTGAGGNAQTPPVLEVNSPRRAAEMAGIDSRLRRVAEIIKSEEERAFEGEGVEALSGDAAKAIQVSPADRSLAQIDALIETTKRTQPDYGAKLSGLRDAVEAADRFRKSTPRVMVMADMATPRPTHVLTRGSYEKPTEAVRAGVPGALPPLPSDSPANRLGLARWLTDPENPLTARVTVNRAWQTFFGTGLVKTSEDFGVQGERPVHPGLLDELAAEFMTTGWDVKALHRRIVTSATYRQSSKVAPGAAELDPENRLLARGARFRLPSWMIRDQALAASGLLVLRDGGPPVRPYQPEGVWEEATFGNKSYRPDSGESLYRRSLFTFWRRIVGPTGFFDSSPRQNCVVKPTRTNSPMHALATLNDVTFVEAARSLAERAIHAGQSPEVRVDRAFRLVLGRSPVAEERRVLVASLARLKSEFAADPGAAVRYLGAGASPRDESIDPTDHAATAALCLAILNLDEALTRE